VSDDTIDEMLSRLPKGKSSYLDHEVAPVLGISVKTLRKWRPLKNPDGTPKKGPAWFKEGPGQRDPVRYPRKAIEEYLVTRAEQRANTDDFEP
jgi:hypothetical protein